MYYISITLKLVWSSASTRDWIQDWIGYQNPQMFKEFIYSRVLRHTQASLLCKSSTHSELLYHLSGLWELFVAHLNVICRFSLQCVQSCCTVLTDLPLECIQISFMCGALWLVPMFWFVVWDRFSLCNPGWPGAFCIDQAGLELIVNHLPLPPKF